MQRAGRRRHPLRGRAAEELLDVRRGPGRAGHRRAGGARAGRPVRPPLAGPGGRRPRLPGRATTGWPRRRRRAGCAGSGRAVSELLELWAGEPIGAVVVDRGGARRHAGRARPATGWPRCWRATALPLVASGGVGGVERPGRRWPSSQATGAGWRVRSSARRSSRAASAWRRGWPRAQRPADPLPRRHRRPRRQGRALRRPDRRGRPGRAGGRATTPRAPTRSPSSTSPPRPTGATRWSRWWRARRSRSSSR